MKSGTPNTRREAIKELLTVGIGAGVGGAIGGAALINKACATTVVGDGPALINVAHPVSIIDKLEMPEHWREEIFLDLVYEAVVEASSRMIDEATSTYNKDDIRTQVLRFHRHELAQDVVDRLRLAMGIPE